MNEFENFRKNITSQYGEDGIIAEMFRRLKVNDPVCIEFGAWDGKYLSNVWNLWSNEGWKALLIEGEADRAASLSESVKTFNKVKVVNAFVTAEGEFSLDSIAKREGVGPVIDLLSIDIDGNDYYIFEKLNVLKPRVVIIEYNPTIPPHLEIVQKEDEYFGASARALFILGQSKGYKLAAITDTNLFLVHNDEFEKLKIEELDLVRYFPGTHLTYLYSSYDGRLFVDKKPPYLYAIGKPDEPSLKQSIGKMLGRSKKEDKKHPAIKSKTKPIPVKLFEC